MINAHLEKQLSETVSKLVEDKTNIEKEVGEFSHFSSRCFAHFAAIFISVAFFSRMLYPYVLSRRRIIHE